MDYPFLGDIYAFDTVQVGFDVVRSRFSAIDELLARENAPGVLVDRYRALDLKAVAETSENDTIRMEFLELLLGDQALLESMDSTQRTALIDGLEEKRLQKITDFASDSYGESAGLVLEGRALAIDDPAFAEQVERDEDLSSFLDDGVVVVSSAAEWTAVQDQIGDGVSSEYGLRAASAPNAVSLQCAHCYRMPKVVYTFERDGGERPGDFWGL